MAATAAAAAEGEREANAQRIQALEAVEMLQP